jgi:prepilin-type N-terminal cleavage/methylation domain-containing protein
MVVNRQRRSRGFTLLELSIVLALIGIIVGGGLMTFSAYLQSSQFNTTVARMDAIEQALLKFSVAYSRIPCPSDLALTTSSANYGLEAGAGSGSSPGVGTGTCTGGSMLPKATFTATNGQAEGGVPVRALQLPDSYMYDGWGRRFRYAVDPTATITGVLPVLTGAGWCGNPITVNDASGTAARSTSAIYVIVSHGANGHGAYTSGGVTLNAGSVNQNEQVNCHCTNAGVSNGYPLTSYQPSGTATGFTVPTYVEMMPTLDSSNNLDNFDDIVTFKEAWQMQTQNAALATSATSGSAASMCIYVGDSTNKWIAQYNSSGTYLNQIGCAPSVITTPPASGTFLAEYYTTIDQSGDLWITDNTGCVADEFSPNGANNTSACSGTVGSFINRWGSFSASASASLGAFNDMGGVAIDKYKNIWVADSAGSRVQMLSGTSFTFIGQVGCDGTNPCTGVSKDGQFDATSGDIKAIAFDKNNNLWVIDSANYRVEEFTINYNNVTGGTNPGVNMGTWVQTIGGGSGCAGGYVNNTTCSTTNGNAACCAPSSLMCSSCASTGSSSGMGNFTLPTDIVIDPDGTSVWVTDSSNNRLEKFTISGATSTLAQVIGGSGGSCSSAYGCTVSGGGTCNTPCTSTSTCYCTSGSSNGQFNTPYGMAFDPQGNLWVVDQGNHRVQELNPATAGINASGGYINGVTGSLGYISKFGALGAAKGQFETPNNISISR